MQIEKFRVGCSNFVCAYVLYNQPLWPVWTKSEHGKEVKSRLYEMRESRIPPMQLEMLKQKNPDLYKELIASFMNQHI
jgi:hypothetical protein